MKITLQTPVQKSFRVQQIAGMFDVPVEEKLTQTFEFQDPPVDDPDWRIGLIVGPSGSGKSTAAKHWFGDCLYTGGNWNSGAVIDNFGDVPVKEITKRLTLAGFSSPPNWLKPYRVLSNGEKFRCDLAKAFTQRNTNTPEETNVPLHCVVFDEYTSVVDRSVAKMVSAALAKALRSPSAADKALPRFVAVTCHYDVMDWLEPDWVLDTADGTVSRRLLRRQDIELQLFRCKRSLWDVFKNYHYLSASLSPVCQCYAALWNGQPVAFCAMLPLQGFKNRWRVSRIVVLPDYQGIGIGSAVLEALADDYLENGKRFCITAAHPSVIAHCKRSAKWQTVNVQKLNQSRRAVVSFEYKWGTNVPRPCAEGNETAGRKLR